MTQLQLELSPQTQTSDRLPIGVTFRTVVDADRFLLTEFQPGHFHQLAKGNIPAMETHLVYLHGEYIGTVNRIFADTPWRISACGELDSKDHGMNFDKAVNALIQWRQQIQESDRIWINSMRFSIA